MSRKLHRQINVERQLLVQLIEDHRPLLEKCAFEVPNRIELSALATMLHAFYSGVENIFKRIAIEFGEKEDASTGWHRSLLDAMRRSTDSRGAAVSVETSQKLREYMEFRHVFRNAYPFQLRWEKMAPLVTGLIEFHQKLDHEFATFIENARDS